MSTGETRRGLARMVAILCGACSAGCAQQGTCQILPGSTPADVSHLYQRYRVPLVIAGDDVLLCSCARAIARQYQGETEARQIGGANQARQIGGDSQTRQIGGDRQARQIGGGGETRQIGGGGESRAVGGASQTRQIGGGSEGRQIGGSDETRQIGGGSQARQIGGEHQARQIGGGSEARQVGGAGSIVPCVIDRSCGGFRYRGNVPVRVFDGNRVIPSETGCVVSD